MSQYKNKYLKYKNKYLELKKHLGGATVIPCDEPSGFNNTLGTCWNSALNSILFYGTDGERIQSLLFESRHPFLLVNKAKQEEIEKILPAEFKDKDNKLKSEKLELILELINSIKNRIINKGDEYEEKLQEKKDDTPDMIVPIKSLRRQNSLRCEDSTGNFIFLFFDKEEQKKIKIYGLENYMIFIYINILNIVLLDRLVNFTEYSYSIIYTLYNIYGNKSLKKMYDEINIPLISESFGAIIEVYQNDDHVSLSNTINHITSFYLCKGKGKYSDNNIIIDHDWKKMFEIIKDLDDGHKKYYLLHDLIKGPFIYLKDEEKIIIFSPIYKVQKQYYFPYHEGNIINFSILTGLDIKKDTDYDQFSMQHVDYYSYFKGGWVEIFEKLIKNGKINLQNENKETALMMCIRLNMSEMFNKLLVQDPKPNLDLQNKNKETALMMCIRLNMSEMFNKLLSQDLKPNLDLQNKNRETALMMCILLMRSEMFNKLLAQDLKPNLDLKDINEETALMMCILLNISKMFGELLALKPNLDLQNRNGETALMTCIRLGILKMFNKLLEQDPKPNLNLQKINGETALMMCISSDNLVMFNKLLEQDPKPNLDLKDINEETALMMCISSDNLVMFNKLLEQDPKPNLNLQDRNGETALMSCIYNKNLGMFNKLLEQDPKPDLDLQNKENETALMISEKDPINEEFTEILIHMNKLKR